MFEVERELKSIAQQGLFRELEVARGLDFSSNDYLGLSSNIEIKRQLILWLTNETQMGGISSRLIRGTSDTHKMIEDILANFLGRTSSLLFGSGYVANEGVISTLSRESIIYSDKLNHASIIDGIRLSRSPVKIFEHNNMNHLEDLLRADKSRLPKFIITESVFSMDGDLAPIDELLSLCEKFNACLVLDEAHSTGVFGVGGAGLLSGKKFDGDKVISVHTCGKALGAYGAFIGCSEQTKNYLVNKCRHFIYTTALAPLQVGHIKIALDYLRAHPELISKLKHNFSYATDQLSSIASVANSKSQIIPLMFKGNHKVMECSKYLKSKGYDVKGIRSPTVPRGQERIRVSIHANHSKLQIDQLVVHLADFTSTEGR